MIERHRPEMEPEGSVDLALRGFIEAAADIADLERLPPSAVVEAITATLRKRIIANGLKSRFDVRHRR